jgi:hypothetical protein
MKWIAAMHLRWVVSLLLGSSSCQLVAANSNLRERLRLESKRRQLNRHGRDSEVRRLEYEKNNLVETLIIESSTKQGSTKASKYELTNELPVVATVEANHVHEGDEGQPTSGKAGAGKTKEHHHNPVDEGENAAPAASSNRTISLSPTKQPTPTELPTRAPTNQPTRAPTKQPTKAPTKQPTVWPSIAPTSFPTKFRKVPKNASAVDESQPASGKAGTSKTKAPAPEPGGRENGEEVTPGGPSMVPISGKAGKTKSVYPTFMPSALPVATRAGQSQVETIVEVNHEIPVTKEPKKAPTEIKSPKKHKDDHHHPVDEGENAAPAAASNRTVSLSPSIMPVGPPAPSNQTVGVPSNSSLPAIGPTRSPTLSPTMQPTKAPTKMPTKSPTKQPTNAPTKQPTNAPTMQPTNAPTKQPTKALAKQATKSPTLAAAERDEQSQAKEPKAKKAKKQTHHHHHPPVDEGENAAPATSNQTTVSPTFMPVAAPSASNQTIGVPSNSSLPATRPTRSPTLSPAFTPSSLPVATRVEQSGIVDQIKNKREEKFGKTNSGENKESTLISFSPSLRPSSKPSKFPTAEPTSSPSDLPTSEPSLPPTSAPSSKPSTAPSTTPSDSPSSRPSESPSSLPSATPSLAPIEMPSFTPSIEPSNEPSALPSLPPVLFLDRAGERADDADEYYDLGAVDWAWGNFEDSDESRSKKRMSSKNRDYSNSYYDAAGDGYFVKTSDGDIYYVKSFPEDSDESRSKKRMSSKNRDYSNSYYDHAGDGYYVKSSDGEIYYVESLEVSAASSSSRSKGGKMSRHT